MLVTVQALLLGIDAEVVVAPLPFYIDLCTLPLGKICAVFFDLLLTQTLQSSCFGGVSTMSASQMVIRGLQLKAGESVLEIIKEPATG